MSLKSLLNLQNPTLTIHSLWLALMFGLLAGFSQPGAGPAGWVLVVFVPLMGYLISRSDNTPFWRWSCWIVLFWAGYYGVGFSWVFSLYPLQWLGISEAMTRALAVMAWMMGVLYWTFLSGLLSCCWRWIYQAMGFAFNQKRDPHRPWLFYAAGLGLSLWVGLTWAGWRMLTASAIHLNTFPPPWVLPETSLACLDVMRPWWMGHLGGLGSGAFVMAFSMGLALILSVACRTNLQKIAIYAGLLVLSGGLSLIPSSPDEEALFPWPHAPINLVIVQPNLPIAAIRGNPATREKSALGLLHQLEELTAQNFLPAAQQHRTTRLFILPEEGLLPWTLNQALFKREEGLSAELAETERVPSGRQGLYARVIHWLKQTQSILMVGGMTYPVSVGHPSNDLLLMQPDKTAPSGVSLSRYPKRLLVPWGEHFPLPEGLRETLVSVGLRLPGNLEPGLSQGNLLEMAQPEGGTLRLGGLVCYELIHPDFAAFYQHQGARLLVNSSNLGWFSGGRLLHRQFLAFAQLRAAETHLPVVISANSGPSALVDMRGFVRQVIQENTAGAIVLIL